MAKGDEKKANERREALLNEQQAANTRLQSSQTPTEQEFIPISQNFQNQYGAVSERQIQDYSDIMGGYRNWREKSISPLVESINTRMPKPFTFERVNYNRDADTTGRAITGYTDFANTGGYSPTDIQELRARGVSPIRASYGNAMMQLDRQRALGGGYSPNYAAATAQMQRELPGQLADATTNVNAQLADSIRQGKLAGLGGLTGIGQAETGARMQAAGMNQQMGVKVQELIEQGMSAKEARQIAAQELLGKSYDMERGLYGTSPGATATFADAAQRAYSQRLQLEQMRNQLGDRYVNNQISLLNPIRTGDKPWWQTAIDVGTSFLPFLVVLVTITLGHNCLTCM